MLSKARAFIFTMKIRRQFELEDFYSRFQSYDVLRFLFSGWYFDSRAHLSLQPFRNNDCKV